MRDGGHAGHGTAVWSSPSWLTNAVVWLDERLAEAGIERTGGVEPFRVRPWATVLKAPTTAGVVWMKAAAPATACEIGLYELLARVVPDRVLVPLAIDRERAWVVLPDGGPAIGARLAGTELVEALGTALVAYGRLQVELMAHVDEMLAAGVPDMRPAIMPTRFTEALDAIAAGPTHSALLARAPTVAAWCDELTAAGLPASLDHNDLHFQNVLGGDGEPTRFYDWGDSVVAHPFAAMYVPLVFVRHTLGVGDDDPTLHRIRDAYLAGFRDLAPGVDLVATLERACHVAKIARALTWARAVRTTREDGRAVDDEWTAAPHETLTTVLHRSYLGDP